MNTDNTQPGAIRRKDREIADLNEILDLLKQCKVCRLALCMNNKPYIVPLNYGYTYADNKLTLYFHSALVGRKIDMLRANPRVCFETDTGHELVRGETACTYSFRYASVIGSGCILFIDDKDEKISALNILMRRQSGEDRDFIFNDADIEKVLVYKLIVEEFTGKRHL